MWGVLKINDIYAHQVSSFIYKYNANMLPMNVINYFIKNSVVHVHNTSSADNFHLSFGNVCVQARSQACKGKINILCSLASATLRRHTAGIQQHRNVLPM